MPKHATHRSQRTRATPYDRAHQTTIARLRVANERIEILKAELDATNTKRHLWKAKYNQMYELIDDMLKYAKGFIDGCEDDMEAKHAELGLRLQMIHLQKK
ncbi:hypothetical protein HYE67_004105 [Fusarium culmorum]|uniref:Uncharacterized protein n=1 Tax=Fusarium culmorum TaxID=5516 RepID=A0A7S8D4J2_FUSCU|nr:hypothetical protein HYE67_004105 [Fusarium culmorum]